MTRYDPLCLSSYLALRWIARPDAEWAPGVGPAFPEITEADYEKVPADPEAVRARLAALVPEAIAGRRAALLLSAGIDSAILAALMGAGHAAYTIRFVADGAEDESVGAASFAEHVGLSHTVVDVPFAMYEESLDAVMCHKRAPLHPVEVGLYAASKRAHADGFDTLVVGIGADSTFGGLDKLLSRDWSFDAFVERYTFLDPRRALREPVDMGSIFEPYRRGESGVDVSGFLKVVHGLGIVQAFENAIEAGGCSMVSPYESVILDAPLDLARIRGGESKYILRAVFGELFGGLPIPEKIAFARPMDVWLGDWEGPKREEFLPRDSDRDWFATLSGEQRWLVYCLERFLDLLDRA